MLHLSFARALGALFGCQWEWTGIGCGQTVAGSRAYKQQRNRRWTIAYIFCNLTSKRCGCCRPPFTSFCCSCYCCWCVYMLIYMFFLSFSRLPSFRLLSFSLRIFRAWFSVVAVALFFAIASDDIRLFAFSYSCFCFFFFFVCVFCFVIVYLFFFFNEAEAHLFSSFIMFNIFLSWLSASCVIFVLYHDQLKVGTVVILLIIVN